MLYITSFFFFRFKSSIAGKNLPDLIKTSKGTGKFGAIFFEDFRFFLQMDPWNRDLLLKYCKMFDVGIVSLVPSGDLPFDEEVTLKSGEPLPFTVRTGPDLRDFSVTANATMLRVTRGGQTEPGPIPHGEDWVTFMPRHDTYSSVASAKLVEEDDERGGDERSLVLQDHGKLDGVRKVLFGGQLRHWVNKLLLLDALHWVSKGKVAVPLTRYILVDIDDVFVGKHRFLPSDVEELLSSQRRLAELVPGFKYNLGFSGGSFRREGSEEKEKAGDEAVVAARDEFWWFPHSFTHFQAHKADNVSLLINEVCYFVFGRESMNPSKTFFQMEKNKRFAEEHGIRVNNGYAVAPHHSGVYPVHQPLYDAWQKVWDIEITSTEEYPHLRPARLRRGYVYSGIQVLPRQTCGLFTKNLFYSEYPGGPQVLEDSIHGGELFLVSNAKGTMNAKLQFVL